jgi:methionyl-tRNA synthetase
MARFKRLDGYDVLYPIGTDEHGQKVEQAARAAGIDPQTLVDRISADFEDTTTRMGVSNDD